MNDTLLKLLQFIRANFWDWQFIVFTVFSIVILTLHLLERKTSFNLNKPFDYFTKFTAKSEIRNYLLVALVSLLVCLTVLLIAGVPVPQTHDEFGYLLAADTFLNGRIANPTPFSPQHFEYFHILLKPVYAAKYPPLQGIFLAFGTLMTGFPIVGVYVTSILSSLSIYWLLRFFFSPGWALTGTFLWIFAPLNIIWCDSYWGGHVAVIGGALSTGAFFRFQKTGNIKFLFVWGTGIFLLLNSRLYEGTLLTGILVLLWFFDILKNKNFGREFYRAVSVVVLVISTNLLFIAFYNYSVTGSPWILPYSLQHSQYHQTPLFVFQAPDSPKPDIPAVVKKLDERWLNEFKERYKNPFSALATTFSRIPIYLFWLTRSPFLLAFFLAGLLFAFRKEHKNQWKTVPLIFALFMIGLFLTTFTGDRFIAPIVGIFSAVTTFCAKIIYEKAKFLRLLVLSLPLIIGAGFLCGMISVELKRAQGPANQDIAGNRAALEKFLKQQPGKHLLFLETADAFPADARFYVYNRADIEIAEIIWAHNLSSEENAALINHFKNRSVWLLKNVNQNAVLVKYENQAER